MSLIREKIQTIFSEVPKRYELINHLLTFGLDILWRKRAAKLAKGANGGRWVDMCTGTGEMAVYLQNLAKEGVEVYGVDFSHLMMAEAIRKREARNIKFIAAEVKALPFPDNSFDLMTMSFAARNNNINKDILIQCFAEFCRVLKPGGRFINLETSRPTLLPIRKVFDLYVKLFVDWIGRWLSQSKNAYAYLASTIPRFYDAEALAQIMTQAGFNNVTFQRLMFGVAAIHQGTKL